MLFLFFANKPKTIIEFFLIIIFILLFSFYIGINSSIEMFIMTFIALTPSLVNLYLLTNIYRYVFSSEDVIICSVNLAFLKTKIENIIWLSLSFILICLSITVLCIPCSLVIMPLLIFVTLLTLKFTEAYIKAKIISEAIKNNHSISNLSIDQIYSQLREILTRNLIK